MTWTTTWRGSLSVHEDLILLLIEHGLVVDAKRGESPVVPGKTRHIARSGANAVGGGDRPDPFRRSSTCSAPTVLSLLEQIEEVRDSWSGLIDLAVVDRVRALLLGVPEDAAGQVDASSGIEIARYDLVRFAKRVQDVIRIRQSDVAEGTPREDVWRLRFALLASTPCALLLSSTDAGGSLARGFGHGLRWFLQRIDASGHTRVEIITGPKSGQQTLTVDQIQSAFSALWSELRVVALAIASHRCSRRRLSYGARPAS